MRSLAGSRRPPLSPRGGPAQAPLFPRRGGSRQPGSDLPIIVAAPPKAREPTKPRPRASSPPRSSSHG
ncbi:hypothetical protein GUJ93_ZPchr0014g47076 [Zizania palustris]|uniref:Uncharacterized protein n=1 Tax=Zizania palustris TaxID=103762 RepID=A0A8J5T8I7_ZIZPA|nr:hypothetical protein GUJ93_ZPchr0014g47076 [Zizania palustris]